METVTAKRTPAGHLARKLGLFDSTMLMMGVIIGSGIFLTTGIIADYIPSASLILLVWIIGGLITLTGALSFAELGAAMPEAGGQYIYLREAYGPLTGFLSGWITLLVYISGSIAGLGVAFAEYFSYFFPALSTSHNVVTVSLHSIGIGYSYTLSAGQLLAVFIIVVFTAFNYVGVGLSKNIQNFFSVVKIGTLFAFIVLGFIFGWGMSVDYSVNPAEISIGKLLTGLGLALILVSWAFDGWNNINFVAGEIKKPERTLPAAIFIGTLGIMLVYFLINYVYVLALPVSEMRGVVRIAEKATTALFGSNTAMIISAAVCVSVLGAVHGTIFVGARVYYAMARDGLFFHRAGEVHRRFKTPAFAILIQGIWSSFLALTGRVDQLFTFAIFIAIVFWGLSVAAVFTLRKKSPDIPRPYKTWGYPVTPLIFIFMSVGILISTLIEAPVQSLAGLGITAVGVPVYYYWRKKSTV